jgi:hypothetical protein
MFGVPSAFVRSTVAVALLVLAAALVAGCSREPAERPPVPSAHTALSVAVDQAEAHAHPAADSEIVAHLMIASNVWADSMSGSWWRIEHDGRHVWLHKSLVDTGHLPEALVVHRQARALEEVLQRRAAVQESELDEIRENALGRQ